MATTRLVAVKLYRARGQRLGLIDGQPTSFRGSVGRNAPPWHLPSASGRSDLLCVLVLSIEPSNRLFSVTTFGLLLVFLIFVFLGRVLPRRISDFLAAFFMGVFATFLGRFGRFSVGRGPCGT